MYRFKENLSSVPGYKSQKFRDVIGIKNTILRVISEYTVFTAKKLDKISQRVSLEKERSPKIEPWGTPVFSGWGIRRNQQRKPQEASLLLSREKDTDGSVSHMLSKEYFQEGSDNCANFAVSVKMQSENSLSFSNSILNCLFYRNINTHENCSLHGYLLNYHSLEQIKYSSIGGCLNYDASEQENKME